MKIDISKYLGIPYQHRGSDNSGVDCYGLPRLFYKTEFGIGFFVNKNISGAKNDIVVLMNGDPQKTVNFTLPSGEWSVIVNAKKAGTDIIENKIQGKIVIQPTSGMVLIK